MCRCARPLWFSQPKGSLHVCLFFLSLLAWSHRTSGARISVIEPASGDDGDYHELYAEAVSWDRYDDPDAWVSAVEGLLKGASTALEENGGGLGTIRSVCVSGTSASCLMVDRTDLRVTRSPRMYDYDVIAAAQPGEAVAAKEAMQLLDQHAPPLHTARARTGSLAKLLAWAKEVPLNDREILCHQSDYVSLRLLKGPPSLTSSSPAKAFVAPTQVPLGSDWHNCLKLGFDVREREWPPWLVECLEDAGIRDPLGTAGEGSAVLPERVVSPGFPVGTIHPSVARSLGLREDTLVAAGTTDSNAAFFAAAGTNPSPGTAVTSLGSTLAMKQLSLNYVEDADRGIYSHRFPNFKDPDQEAWLVGGASNVGCAVLRKLGFSNEELADLSSRIDPEMDSNLTYYPLVRPGERFPVADPNKEPILEPVPEDRADFLHGILQSIADVEREGFSALRELGAPPLTVVWTCGGGSKNDAWSRLRERRLEEWFGSRALEADDGSAPSGTIRVFRATCTEASFGAALLAAAALRMEQ